MSISDDIFDLQDHLKDGDYEEAFERITDYLADLERYEMRTENAMRGFSELLRAFNVVREYPDDT